MKLLRAVHKLRHSVLKLVDILRYGAFLVAEVYVKPVEKLVGGDSEGVAHLEAGGIGFYLEIVRNVYLFAVGDIKALCKPRESRSDNDRAVAVIHGLAVGDFNIAEIIVVKDKTCYCREGNVYLLGLSVNLNVFGLVVGVVETDLNFAALSLDIGGGNFLAVEEICYFKTYRKLGV